MAGDRWAEVVTSTLGLKRRRPSTRCVTAMGANIVCPLAIGADSILEAKRCGMAC